MYSLRLLPVKKPFVFKIIFTFSVLFLGLTQNPNKIFAQEASLKIQKNIVERIDRLDEYIRDTIDPNMLQNSRASWERLKNLRDSLEILNGNLRSWSVFQDSIAALLGKQQNQIGSQQRMIDAINWQIKDVLRENGELKGQLGEQTSKANQFEVENRNLQNKLRTLSLVNDSLTAKWSVNEKLLKEILAITTENQTKIKALAPDSTTGKAIRTDTTSFNNDF